MNSNRWHWAILVGAVLAASTAMAKKPAPPPETHDGLKLVGDSKADVAYVHPDADFSGYNRVMILEPAVAFKKNWERDNRRSITRRVSSKDIERIKHGMTELFMEVFTQELEAGGYPVVEEPADDVLLLRPAIIDLDIAAPDVQQPGRNKSFSTNAGSAALYIELYDSVTGQILARAVDYQRARDTVTFQWTTSTSNRQEGRRIFKRWTGMLVSSLNEIHKGQ